MFDITIICNVIFALLSAVVSVFLIPYIRSRTSVVQYEKLQTWVKTAVTAAEQIYKGSGRGVEKKNFVLTFLNKQGLTYDETAIEALIESSVKMLNIAQNN